MKNTLILLSTILLFNCSNGQKAESVKDSDLEYESPLKGIKKVKIIEYDTELNGNDTLVKIPHRSIFEYEYNEDGYMTRMVFSMSLKTPIPVYKVHINGNDLINLTESLSDSLNSTSFTPSDYLDFTNGKFDTTSYTFDKREGNTIYLKGSDGGMEIFEIKSNYTITPNPLVPDRPNSIKKYDENGYLVAEAIFGFQDTYHTEYIITKSENDTPLEGYAIISTYQPQQIEENIMNLDFSGLTPSQTSIRFVKFEYEK